MCTCRQPIQVEATTKVDCCSPPTLRREDPPKRAAHPLQPLHAEAGRMLSLEEELSGQSACPEGKTVEGGTA